MLNTEFFDENMTQVSASVYEMYQDTLRSLSSHANDSTMTTEELEKWELVALALVSAFVNERGVMVYQNNDAISGWFFCGWIDLSQTFVKATGYFRMCSTVESIGLPSILREPTVGLDFLIDTLLTYADDNDYLGDVLQYFDRAKVTGNQLEERARMSEKAKRVARKKWDWAWFQKRVQNSRQEEGSSSSEYDDSEDATDVFFETESDSCTLLLPSPPLPRSLL